MTCKFFCDERDGQLVTCQRNASQVKIGLKDRRAAWLYGVRVEVKCKWREYGLDHSQTVMVQIPEGGCDVVLTFDLLTDKSEDVEFRGKLLFLRPMVVAAHLIPFQMLMYAFLQVLPGTKSDNPFWKVVASVNGSNCQLDYLISALCNERIEWREIMLKEPNIDSLERTGPGLGVDGEGMFEGVETLLRNNLSVADLAKRFEFLGSEDGALITEELPKEDCDLEWENEQLHAIIVKSRRATYTLYLKFDMNHNDPLASKESKYIMCEFDKVKEFDPKEVTVDSLVKTRQGVLIRVKEGLRGQIVQRGWERVVELSGYKRKLFNPSRPVRLYVLGQDGYPCEPKLAEFRRTVLKSKGILVSYHPVNLPFPFTDAFSVEDNSYLLMDVPIDESMKKTGQCEVLQIVWIHDEDPRKDRYRPVAFEREPHFAVPDLQEKLRGLLRLQEEQRADDWVLFEVNDEGAKIPLNPLAAEKANFRIPFRALVFMDKNLWEKS